MKKRYKKGSAWKRANWDKWTFWRKVRHCIAVVLSLCAVVAIFLVTAYVVLFIFGVHGFLLKFRDTVLLEIMHWLFG